MIASVGEIASARDLALRSPPLVRGYAVFGGVLRSALEFPELRPVAATDAPDWTLRVATAAPPSTGLTLLGRRQLGRESYALWRTTDGLRLEYSHAGACDISQNGALLDFYIHSDALLELVRAIVLGPALALALESSGFLCLHGSAVAIGPRAVGFLGPKHHGKSTLAAALTAAGARLIGDDLLAVAPGPPAKVRPGAASVRLWEDTAGALALDRMCGTLIPGVKATATDFADCALAQSETMLAALYVIQPVPPGTDGRAAWRTPMRRTEATVALAQQAKLADSLVGLRTAGARLASAAAVAAIVPVWTLYAVRDLSRLDDLVKQILIWHQPPHHRTNSETPS
ncbi:MAG TPA: hypothetical protein VJU87_05185 [Gemmatimonadaceae bacterium]|nr:hypothetical protein [Gemmatimonadaceae bacterium]